MKIDDILLGIRQAKDFASEQAVSPEVFIGAAHRLDIRMFIRIPVNDVDTFLLGTSNRRMISTLSELASDDWPFDHDRPIQVSADHEYLCIDPDDYKLIAQKIITSKRIFSHVGIYEEDVGLINLSPTDYARRLAKSKPGTIYITGSFRTFEKNRKSPWGIPEHEKSIDFSFADLLVAPQDISRLAAELEINTPKIASTPLQWMSERLRDLNELHMQYFPLGNQVDEISLKKIKEEIDKVIRIQWPTNNNNNTLFQQAVFAILPDKPASGLRNSGKLTPETQEQFKNHSSTALLLINQEAKKLWKDKQEAPDRKYPKREIIVGELRGLGLTVNLSMAAAKIIRPDSEQRIPSFRKYNKRK